MLVYAPFEPWRHIPFLSGHAESHFALTPRRMDVLILLMVVSFAATVVGMRVPLLWDEYDRAIAQAQAASRDLARITEEYAGRVFETSDMMASETIRHIRERGGTVQARDGADSYRYLLDLSRRTTGDHILVVDFAGIPAVVTTQFPRRRSISAIATGSRLISAALTAMSARR